MKKPYISIIAASRNDNHGENMQKRMRMFVNGLIEQTNKYQLACELIIVEWNPPQNNPLLNQVLPKPQKGDYLSVRYIVVPETIHSKYRFAKEVPLYQMIAKNVGIRRAKGDFILCTNVDLLFSDALFEILAKQNLSERSFYRANRCDVPNTIKEDWTLEEKISFCRVNILRVLGKDSLYPYLFNWPSWLFRTRIVPRFLNFLAGCAYKFYNPVKLQFMQIDSNACGDFTLMHKNIWIDIEGYPELDLYSIHIDTMGLVAASALGYTQVILPVKACTYHIDHQNGWESLDPIDKVRFVEERPGIGYDVVIEASNKVIKEKTRFGLNKPDWGFVNHEFEEYVFNQ